MLTRSYNKEIIGSLSLTKMNPNKAKN